MFVGRLKVAVEFVLAPLSFRPLGRSDFPLLQQWLSAPHVDAWWREGLDLAGVEEKVYRAFFMVDVLLNVGTYYSGP